MTKADIWNASRRMCGARILSALSGVAIVGTAMTVFALADDARKPVTYLEQGWSPEARSIYYYTAQGGSLMPVAWLAALEAEDAALGAFMGRASMEPLGLIFDDTPDEKNPYGWPVGMAIDTVPEIPVAGPTCAFCHTGQVRHDGKTLRIDGGQGTFDSKAFGAAFGAAVLATGADPERRARFIARAIENGYPADRMEADFTAFHDNLAAKIASPNAVAAHDTPAGPARMDAVNGIANTIFADALNVPSNARPLDAPVNYPHLWDMWLFDYMQYNASARQPMGRDMAEAIGQPGVVSLLDPATGEPFPEPRIWQTLLRPHGLWEIREVLDTLAPPPWPEDVFGPTDQELAGEGRELFAANCASCHGIKTIRGSRNAKTGNPTEWHVPIIPLERIGTDPVHAVNFSYATYDGSKLGLPTNARVQEGLAALVVPMKRQAYVDADIPESEWGRFNGFDRPDVIDAPACGYKARPLVGVWATAPYLHNGSVPTIYDLLSEERPAQFHFGSIDYDPVRLGFVTTEGPGTMLLDTSVRGNGNGGHWFTDEGDRWGRIGRALTDREKNAIIEYLKIATNSDYPVEEIPGPVAIPCADDQTWADAWVAKWMPDFDQR